MGAHQLTFGPVGLVEPGQHVHLLSGKQQDVVTMHCPECGERIFIYYRLGPPMRGEDEHQSERNEE